MENHLLCIQHESRLSDKNWRTVWMTQWTTKKQIPDLGLIPGKHGPDGVEFSLWLIETGPQCSEVSWPAKKKPLQLLCNLARTSKLREIVKDGRAGRAAVHGVAKSRIRLRNGTTATNCRRHCTYWHSSKLSNTFCVVVINPVFSFLHAFWGQHTQGWSGSAGSLRASQVALVVKNPPADAGDKRHAGSIPGSGRSPGGGHGSPLQCSCLENPMHRRAWWATVHGVAKSQTRLNRWSTHAGNLKSNTMEI